MNTSGMNTYEAIVIGAGSMGMSAGYHLAAAGVRVLMIDAFDPPHAEGSHHGDTRLIRHAYPGHPAYVSMALRAGELWQQLEGLTGTTLFEKSGVLNFASPDVYSYHDRVENASRYAIPLELLDAAEIRRRWPGVVIPEDTVGAYESEAGYLYSERCIAAYRSAALAAGATLLSNTAVSRVKADGSSVEVLAGGETYRAEKAILSAGAWFRTLEPFVSLPVRSLRKVVGWFEPQTDRFDAGVFPGFTFRTPFGAFYGFPNIAGSGVKIGRHDGGAEWRPGETPAPFGADPDDEGDLRLALTTHMPAATGRLLRGAVCRYELSPDDDFIIDRHPEHAHVLVAGGFSGHGFKFASVVGEILADLTTRGAAKSDISPFALARFG